MHKSSDYEGKVIEKLYFKLVSNSRLWEKNPAPIRCPYWDGIHQTQNNIANFAKKKMCECKVLKVGTTRYQRNFQGKTPIFISFPIFKLAKASLFIHQTKGEILKQTPTNLRTPTSYYYTIRQIQIEQM